MKDWPLVIFSSNYKEKGEKNKTEYKNKTKTNVNLQNPEAFNAYPHQYRNYTATDVFGNLVCKCLE